MTDSLVPVGDWKIAQQQRGDYSPEQLELIKRTICKGATDDQLQLFMGVCRRTGLDPFSKMIYAVMRNGQMTIQVSIDGFRSVASDTGEYEGQVGPYWCGEDGEWKDVWLSPKPPVAAKVGVFRKDFREACWGVARYAAYAQNSPFWTKMGDNQIAKCAEALALRKAFPQKLSKLYVTEEMEQADEPRAPRTPRAALPEHTRTYTAEERERYAAKPEASKREKPQEDPPSAGFGDPTPDQVQRYGPPVGQKEIKAFWAGVDARAKDIGLPKQKEEIGRAILNAFSIEHSRDIGRDIFDEMILMIANFTAADLPPKETAQ